MGELEAKQAAVEILKRDLTKADAKLEIIEAGYDGLQHEMDKQLAEKDAEITKLKHDLSFLGGQAASMSNTIADYASKMNSLALYITGNDHSTEEAKGYANDVLDFIVPKLESG